MSASYRQFLASPNTALLADKATLHYVTTTTTFTGAAAIIKHLNTLQKQVRKKKQEVLNIIDGGNVVAFEVDTALEFLTSGGIYLPGLDDNFLSDRIAYLPILHIVSLDATGKISQIRLQWDQGSLLKQLEIIGTSGRNWPIRDSREQLSLIQSCIKSTDPAVTHSQDHNDVVIRTRGASTNAIRDPHASLHLAPSREEIEATAASAVVSPYAGHRPQQRSLADILVDESGEGAGSGAHDRSASPSKAGQGKNHQAMRLFDGQEYNEDDDTPKGGSKYIRPNPSKYSHFDFADGSDPQDRPQPAVRAEESKKSKHDSQWSFDDFVTPQKNHPSKSAVRYNDVRHFDVDAASMGETPHQVGKGRRDAETHFELQDDGERVAHPNRQGTKAKGTVHNEGLGLYKNNLFNQEDATPGPKRALGNITNLKDRGKDFEAHFAMTDDSPSQDEPQRAQNVPEARKKAVKMMDANWDSYDQSPTQKENQSRSTRPQGDQRIHISGDGMGGKQGTDRSWMYGGTPEGERIHIAGDGMGGKKGTDRSWLYGAAGDDEQAAKPGVRQGKHAATERHWDF